MNQDISTAIDKYDELHERFISTFQGRSDFQIANFVVAAHSSPERQYAQCVTELQAKYFAIKRADITRRRLRKELGDIQCQFDREEKEVSLQELDIALIGALREFDTLYQIYKSFPAFTHEQLQAAEKSYWVERIATQAQRDIEAHGSVSPGNAEALQQVGLIDGYSKRFLESVQDHPGLVKGTADDLLSLQTEQG